MQRHRLTETLKFNKGNSDTPGPEKPPAAGQTGADCLEGFAGRVILLQLRNMSQQLILAGREADSALFSLEKGKGELITAQVAHRDQSIPILWDIQNSNIQNPK